MNIRVYPENMDNFIYVWTIFLGIGMNIRVYLENVNNVSMNIRVYPENMDNFI
jgi:hypothetical protein